MKTVKTIDEIYEEVRDFDYVITNDAPLATALNARIDVCKLDGFAYTPRALAGVISTMVLKGKALSSLETIDEIEKETGYDFKYIHSEISNIRDIRRYTADVASFLNSKKARKVLDIYSTLPTSTKVMEIFDPTVYHTFMTSKKIAVIGLDLFDDLDKHFIPPSFTEIELFKNTDFSIDRIHAIGNDRQIAGSIADLITLENCNETAIVLDTGGAVSDAVRSALYRRKIPFKNSLDVKDLSQIRDFLQFLSLSLDYYTIRVGDVRELFSVYQTGFNKNKGNELRPELDNYLLCRAPLGDDVEEVTARLMDTMRNIHEHTFGLAMDKMFSTLPQKSSVEMVLKNMKLLEKKITPQLVNRLSYAINNIEELKHNEQVPENEKKGVLLVDCKNSVFVDRPFVIFIGMDESWEVTAPGKDYVDKEKLDEDNALRLSILLQQGTSRIYAVKPVTKGKDTIPCPTFQTIYRLERDTREIGCFEDLCREYVKGSWFRGTPRPAPEMGIVGTEAGDDDWNFSKSKYNAYSDCPIKFMFTRLMKSEDNEYTVFGNCMHEFAEFYFCYPELVKEKGLAHYVGELEEMYAGMSSECEREIDTSRIRVYLNNIVRYIDMIRPDEVPLDAPMSSREYPNWFMGKEGLEYGSTYTESELPSRNPLFAKFDVCFDSHIADYKTGKTKEASEIIKGFTRRGKNLSEFQALIYLQVLGEKTPARPCTFDMFFVGDNDIASVREDFDIRRNIRKVKYCRESAAELAFGPNGTLRSSISTIARYSTFYNDWDPVCSVLMEYSEYGNYDTDSCATALLNAVHLKDNKGNRSDAKGLAKKAKDCMENPYLTDSEGCVLIPSDVMEKFVEQVREDRIQAGKDYNEPIYNLRKGNIACRKCSYYKACMKGNVEEDEEAEE